MIQLLEEAAMGFTVRDFNDLMRLLDRHPEWVEALRQRLLTRELLDSPKTLRRLSLRVGRVERAVEDLKATVQDLAQSVQALTQSVAALIQAQQQRDEAFAAFRAEVDRRFAELAEAQRRTEESLAAHRAETDRRFAELAEAQRRHYEEFAAHRQEFLEYRAETDRRFAELATAIQALAQRVDNLDGLVRGWVHEDRYRTRPRRYRRLLLDPHILSTEAREALLRQAEAAGRLTPEEAAELEDADVLVQGRSRATGGEAFRVVEVSAKVDTDDVERAVERAEILRKARPEAEVIPVAAGPEIHPLAARAARDQGVWWLTDGRPYAPHEIPQEP
jgi:DNA repair exonuclease SbcCD ATPase subunit